jgi:3-methyladenine DNA glycosylase/8-oxoguanine DNA glycosylase
VSVKTVAREPAHPDGDAGFRFLLGCGDPIMASLVGRIGRLDHGARRRGRPDDAYGSLVRTIVGQQLSTKAARTIYGRLAALFGDRPPTPAELIAADEDALRAVGISRQKIGYLRDLAHRVHAGELELDVLPELPDEEVFERITAVKGLGRWSADMFKSITAAYAGGDHLVCAGYRGALRATRIAYKRRGGIRARDY